MKHILPIGNIAYKNISMELINFINVEKDKPINANDFIHFVTIDGDPICDDSKNNYRVMAVLLNVIGVEKSFKTVVLRKERSVLFSE